MTEIKTRRLCVHVAELLQSEVCALLGVSKLQLRNHVYVTPLLQNPKTTEI